VERQVTRSRWKIPKLAGDGGGARTFSSEGLPRDLIRGRQSIRSDSIGTEKF
jgi:hypothetical protein